MNEDQRLDEAIDRLTEDRSPKAEASRLSEDEQRMLRFAQILRGSRNTPPRSEFVHVLHEQLFSGHRVSRRTAFFSAAGALAAGVLGGLGIERAVSGNGSKSAGGKYRWPALVGKNGKWVQVSTVADVPPGAIRSFTAGSVQGFLINRNGEYRAMSRICTHMGCALKFHRSEQHFVCPCHGAEFDLRGQVRYGAHAYPYELPPLPAINVRVRGEAIEVFGA